MKNVDQEIQDALEAEQAALFDDHEDQAAYFESLKAMFRGQTKWFTFMHLAVMGVFITLMVISAIQFFQVESTRAMIAWATGFAVCIILEGLAELYFVMELNKYIVRLEVKQLELQVAALVSGLQQREASEEP